MSNKIERLKALAEKARTINTYEIERKKNLRALASLFETLQIDQKVDTFDNLFDFKAINLSGILLTSKHLGTVTPGKYAQIIAIAYIQEGEKKRLKNINLRYFGRVENLDETLKNEIVEFILRWRLEKSFRGVDHYRKLLKKLKEPLKM